MSTHEKPAPSDARKVDEITGDIAKTRAGMSATLQQLEGRLNPSELKTVMKEGLDEARSVLDEKIGSAKAAAHEEILELKGAVKEQLHETKDMVARGLADARQTVKQDIQSAIAHTKQSMRDATLGRVEDIATKAGDVMITTRDTLVDTIRQNPVPAALAGIGIAWLLMNRSSSHSARGRARATGYGGYGYGGYDADIGVRVGEAAHRVEDAIGQAGSKVAGAARDAASAAQSKLDRAVDAGGRLVHDAEDATSRLVHEARDATGQLVHSTAAGVRRVEGKLQDSLQANPLAIGAAAVIVGAALGYALPRTDRENEVLGEARHRLLEGATHLAQKASSSLQQIANEAGDTVKESVSASMKS